jgi:hypothetical protein
MQATGQGERSALRTGGSGAACAAAPATTAPKIVNPRGPRNRAAQQAYSFRRWRRHGPRQAWIGGTAVADSVEESVYRIEQFILEKRERQLEENARRDGACPNCHGRGVWVRCALVCDNPRCPVHAYAGF